MGKLRSNPNSVRGIVRSSTVRVAGVKPRLRFPAPVVPHDQNRRNPPVFDRDGNYNYPVTELTDLTDGDKFSGVLAVLAASPVSIQGGQTGSAPAPVELPPAAPDEDGCELPTGVQHAAEDQVLWHDTQGRKHIIYGRYITADLPQAQYTFKVAEGGAVPTHLDDRRIIVVNSVKASAEKPTRIFMYNRTEAGDGKKFDPATAIPMFYVKESQSSGTSSTPTFIGEVFQHCHFPEIDADQRPDTVDLTCWMNTVCATELEEDQTAEPEDDGKVFTPGQGDSSQSIKSTTFGGKQGSTILVGSGTAAGATTPSIPGQQTHCVPGTPFRGNYPIGKIVLGRNCGRKLVHTEGMDWFLESNLNGLSSMFVFLPPYTVAEFEDGPVIPLITNNRLVASDKPEGDKDNQSTIVVNDEGCAGDLDDLFKVKDVAKATAQEMYDQLAKEAAQAFVDKQLATAAGDSAAAAAAQAVYDTVQAKIQDLLTNGANTKIAAQLMLRMLCAPDPRGVPITNGVNVGMLRDMMMLHGNWLVLKTRTMFSLVNSPLDCGPGGLTGPIRFIPMQGKHCTEIIEEMMSMSGPSS